MPLRYVFTWLFRGRVRAGWLRLLLLAYGLNLAASRLVAAQPGPFQFTDAQASKVELPVFMQRNLVVVPLQLNGQGPFNFLLDTGINTSLITDASLRQRLGLRPKQRFMVSGAGEEKPLEAYLVDSVRVELTGLQCPSLPMLLLSNDVLNLSGYVGMPIHGLLGADIFRSFVVEIRPPDERVIFHRPETYQAPRGRRWARIPLDMEGNKTYLTVPVALNDSLTLPLKLVLDTGAGHALSLETSSDARLQLPAQRMRTQLGRGLNGYINGYLGRVTALRLGRYRVPALITSFPDESDVAQRADVFRNGNLGFELLKRFIVIIDYTRNQLLLRPNGTFRQPFEHDMSGFDLMASGPDLRRYVVGKVQPNSPAELSGVQTDDELISINLVPVAQLSMTQINNMFRSYHNRLLLLVLRRPSGTLYTTAMRLQRRI